MNDFQSADGWLFAAKGIFVTFGMTECLMYKRARLRRREIGLA